MLSKIIAFFFPIFSIAICDYIWIEEAAGENFTKLLTLKPPKSLIFFFCFSVVFSNKSHYHFDTLFLGVSSQLTVLELEEAPESSM